ncbi:MAG TPA: CHAT domain-containing tetratricopeptide repeat protein, partial [Pirellulales bacterium]
MKLRSGLAFFSAFIAALGVASPSAADPPANSVRVGAGAPAQSVSAETNALQSWRSAREAGRHAEAIPFARTVEATLPAGALSNTSGSLALALELGAFFNEAGDFSRASRLLERVRDEAKSSGDDATCASELFHPAYVEMTTHKFNQAREHIRESIAIRTQKLGPEHPATLEARLLFSAILARSEQTQASRREGEAAIEITERVLKDDLPTLARVRRHWGDALSRIGDAARAAEVLDQAAATLADEYPGGHRLLIETRMSLATALSDMGRSDERLALIEANREACRTLLGPDHLYYGWLCNNLGLALLDRKDFAGAQAMYEESLKIKTQALGPDNHDVALGVGNLGILFDQMAQYEKSMPLFERSQAMIAKEFGDDSPLLISVTGNIAVSFYRRSRYREALRHAEKALALCEASLGAAHPDTFWVRNLVVSSRSALRLDEASSDVDIAALRRSLGDRNPTIGSILRPLTSRIADFKTWIISPDSRLWLMPWAALPEGEKYVAENHIVRCVSVGRDVLAGAATEASSPPLIVADPDYDLNLKSEEERVRGIRRLEGAAREAEAIFPLLAKWNAGRPRLVRGVEAIESVVKTAQRPRVLTLATHGYVLSEEFAQMNPLIKCGVVMAGANAPRTKNGDDGLLTGLEVLQADLRGTDLVLLSACQTAVGELAVGEGTA